MVLANKDEAARFLAETHFQIEPALKQVIRVRHCAETEASPNEPIKLLEVNETTIPTGIMPLQFAPDFEFGMPYSSVIIEVTPQEYDEIRRHSLLLPNGWRLGEEIFKTSVGGPCGEQD